MGPSRVVRRRCMHGLNYVSKSPGIIYTISHPREIVGITRARTRTRTHIHVHIHKHTRTRAHKHTCTDALSKKPNQLTPSPPPWQVLRARHSDIFPLQRNAARDVFTARGQPYHSAPHGATQRPRSLLRNIGGWGKFRKQEQHQGCEGVASATWIGERVWMGAGWLYLVRVLVLYGRVGS